MIHIEKMLYDKVKSEISKWDEDDIYAISFFVNSNESYKYKNYTNVSTWAISYNTESDCEGADSLDEERWNYAFWRQNEIAIIDIEEPNEYTDELYKWYAENGIDNIGYVDMENQYDDECNYIGKGPVGHYELIKIATNVAKKMQEDGFISDQFKKPIPIIIHGLEYAWYDIEATKKANPNGEADTFIKAMDNSGNIPPLNQNVFAERKYPFSLFLIGFITNIFFRFFWLLIPGVILLIVGIFVDWCLYAGLVLLGIDMIASFIEQMRIRQATLLDSDNEQFRQFQDALLKDGNVYGNIRNFVENTIDEYLDDEENNLVVDMYDAVCKKSEYGNNIEKLNEHERVFFITQTLEQEVNNGGFSQFFCNSSGDFSNELVDAFTKIGALKTAEICKKAVSIFSGNIPADRNEREELLDNPDCDDILNDCDDVFYNYEDDLNALNYSYIMEHRAFFNESDYI